LDVVGSPMTKDCFQVDESIKSQRPPRERVFHTDRMAAHDGKALLPFDQPCLPVLSHIAKYRSRSAEMSHVLSFLPILGNAEDLRGLS
jgi:hypothetical protein